MNREKDSYPCFTLCLCVNCIYWSFLGGSANKDLSAMQQTQVGKIPWRRKWQPTPVILAWGIPWTEKPGGLQSLGSQRVGHNWVTSLFLSCVYSRWDKLRVPVQCESYSLLPVFMKVIFKIFFVLISNLLETVGFVLGKRLREQQIALDFPKLIWIDKVSSVFPCSVFSLLFHPSSNICFGGFLSFLRDMMWAGNWGCV